MGEKTYIFAPVSEKQLVILNSKNANARASTRPPSVQRGAKCCPPLIWGKRALANHCLLHIPLPFSNAGMRGKTEEVSKQTEVATSTKLLPEANASDNLVDELSLLMQNKLITTLSYFADQIPTSALKTKSGDC